MRKTHLFACMAFCITCVFCSAAFSKVPDSLIAKEYGYYIKQLDRNKNNPALQRIYAMAYLTKAKTEKSWEEIMYGYKELLHLSTPANQLMYSDSMIVAASRAMDRSLLGSAYLTKGIVLYDQKKYTQALNNYIIANDIISKTQDRYLLYKIKFNIAQLKYFVGEFTESADLFRECIAYFEKEDKVPYINSLHSLSMCYIRLKQYALCTETNSLGIKESVKQGYSLMIPYFTHSEGINQYHLGNHTDAIRKLKSILPILRERKDFANCTVAHFYIGKSYLGLKQIEQAIPYFMKIDTAFRERKYVRQDFRESYGVLISYYRRKGNQALEILYARRLIEADTVLDDNDKYVSRKLKKGYDHKTLSDNNQMLQEDGNTKDNWLFVAAVVIVISVCGIFYLWRLYYKNKEYFTQKFSEFVKSNGSRKPVKADDDLSDISTEVLDATIQKLKKFEADKKFLAKGITQVKMAKSFGTNTAYISRIVYFHSGEKFADYINNLKLDYILVLLESENKYRNYTTKALGDEACFNSKQNFVAAFKKKTGVTPGEYVTELIKKNRGE